MTKASRSGWQMLASALLALVTGPACARLNLDEDAANQAADSTEVTSGEGALISAGTDDPATALLAADVAAAAEAGAGARFTPAGCATATRSGTTVTYQLTDCTGRFGLAHVTGTLVADFNDAPAGVAIAVTGQGLQVNRATMDIAATAVLSDEGSSRKLVVSTHGSGVGPRGHTFTRDGGYTIIRDPATSCIALDGTWQLMAGGLRRDTTVSGLQRCDGSCPGAGGQIVHTGFRGRTVTLTFDGSAVAQWASSSGRTGTLDLTCGG